MKSWASLLRENDSITIDSMARDTGFAKSPSSSELLLIQINFAGLHYAVSIIDWRITKISRACSPLAGNCAGLHRRW